MQEVITIEGRASHRRVLAAAAAQPRSAEQRADRAALRAASRQTRRRVLLPPPRERRAEKRDRLARPRRALKQRMLAVLHRTNDPVHERDLTIIRFEREIDFNSPNGKILGHY